MTPSKERQMMKDIKDLLDANVAMDAKQEAGINALNLAVRSLKKKVKALEDAGKQLN